MVTFGPYPGSDDFHGLVERGEVVVDEAYPYVALARGSSESVSYNPRMTNRQMRAAQWSMMVVFYALGHLLHPKRFVDHVRASGLRSRGDRSRPVDPHEAQGLPAPGACGRARTPAGRRLIP